MVTEVFINIYMCTVSIIIICIVVSIIIRANRKYKIILNDLNKKIVVEISASNPEKSLARAVPLYTTGWMIAAIMDCDKMPQLDLIKIICSLKNTQIEELHLERIRQPISYLWISPIKSVRSISLKDSIISHEFLNEISKIQQVESLKIFGYKTQWKETKDPRALNKNIQALLIEKTSEKFLKNFIHSTQFKSIRDIHLNRSGLTSFNMLLDTCNTRIRKLKITNETLHERDCTLFSSLKSVESLILLGIDFKRSEEHQNKHSESKDTGTAFAFENLWQFKTDDATYRKLFSVKDSFQTQEKNIYVTINDLMDKGLSVEYQPKYKTIRKMFITQKVCNALQVKITYKASVDKAKKKTDLENFENLKYFNNSIYEKRSVIFLEDAEIKELSVQIETEKIPKYKMQNLLKIILKQTEKYRLEKISVNFKHSYRIDKSYIERMIEEGKHTFLKELVLSNIVLIDLKSAAEEEMQTLYLKPKKLNSTTRKKAVLITQLCECP